MCGMLLGYANSGQMHHWVVFFNYITSPTQVSNRIWSVHPSPVYQRVLWAVAKARVDYDQDCFTNFHLRL